MSELEDGVRASQEDIQRMLARSYSIWSSYSKDTKSQDGLPPYHLQLRNILGKVPAYLANGLTEDSGPPQLRLEQRGSKQSELFISGHSIWRTAKESCGLKNKIIPYQILLGTQRSTLCSFTTDSRFTNWPGLYGKRIAVSGNVLAVLAFAWAYILSARWLEMQQSDTTAQCVEQENRIFYMVAEAKGISDSAEKSPDALHIDLGSVDDDAARWWAAILAPGEGWRAEITRNTTVYRSPWSICITATQLFRIRRSGHHEASCRGPFVPPSSDAALRYLADFVVHHCIDSQCSVALAAALTFPFLGSRSAKLPLPNMISPSTLPPVTPRSLIPEGHQKKGIVWEEGKLLCYYMTLSCNTRGMHALLCSPFFDAQVPCNLVSPWFQPIIETFDPLFKKGDLESVAIIMGRRQPKLAALWMGAAISGMADPILQWARSGLTAIELHAAAWTATTHSFISLVSDDLYGHEDQEISRSDECRLLFLTDAEGYSRIPVCPWKPFGNTALGDTEIEVRNHGKCTGHYLQYIGWSWNLQNESELEDPGFTADVQWNDSIANAVDFCSTDQLDERILKNDMLSEHATRSIFGWLRSSGWPKGEKEIYCHSWIGFDESDEEIDDTSSDVGEIDNTIRAVEVWLTEQFMTGWYSVF
ncbi:hypothetical protein ONS95_001990 [Cadophora gregata]|uniref:uncharacterized protein n=1 Tax=Cadophora gregata TaxID=51156 RepID=UPI0026DD3490|nr:uncharacterized protein ONS95_001990 [Cadophora gregata]KAK0111646.1 hypothetical protein ONS95_001990 [Cadophora gregata]KAK0111878.1 hypothetical protein ONS96_001147 [Cadophora gregata f. sp. sojae]